MKIEKIVYEYMKSLNIQKINNFDEIIINKYGKQKAEEIFSVIDKGSNIKQVDKSFKERYKNNRNKLYAVTNANIEMAEICESYFDADILKKCCIWIGKNIGNINGPVLDVGCGCGIITCFIASLLPKTKVVGIDISVESINTAIMFKKKLNLDNVDFKVCDIKNHKDKYNTVTSFRTMHENIGPKYSDIKFKDFYEQIDSYEQLYKEYVSDIASRLDEGGKLFAVERIETGTELMGILSAFQKNSCAFKDVKNLMTLLCNESNEPEKTKLTAFSITKDNMSEDEVFNNWASVVFNVEEGNDAKNDYLLSTEKGELLFGHRTFDENNNMAGLHAVYKQASDPNWFLMYQANVKIKSLEAYEMKRLDEAKSVFSQCKINDLKKGFRFEELNK